MKCTNSKILAAAIFKRYFFTGDIDFSQTPEVWTDYDLDDGEKKSVINIVAALLQNFKKFDSLDEGNKKQLTEFINKLFPASALPEDPDQTNKEKSRVPENESGTPIFLVQRLEAFKYLYAKNPGVEDLIMTTFKLNLVTAMYFKLEHELGNPAYIVPSSDLPLFNYNICKVQAHYFKQIVEFLQTVDKSIYEGINPSLYINDLLNARYVDVMTGMYNYITTQKAAERHDNLILKGWGKALSNSYSIALNNDQEAYDYYSAVEAWYLLHYFDDSLSEILGTNISFSPIQRNMPARSTRSRKYTNAISKEGRYQGFSMDDLRNGFSEAGRLATILIESLKRYDVWSGNEQKGSTITVPQVILAFAKIKLIVQEGLITSNAVEKESSVSRFIDAVVSRHNNPVKAIYTILDSLFNNQGNNLLASLQRQRGNARITNEDATVLFSLYVQLFSKENQNLGTADCDVRKVRGLMYLESTIRANRFNNGDAMSYVDTICGLIDRVALVDYLNASYEDEEQVVQIRPRFNTKQAVMNTRDDVNARLHVGLPLDAKKKLIERYKLVEVTAQNGVKIKLSDEHVKNCYLIVNPRGDGDNKRPIIDKERPLIKFIYNGQEINNGNKSLELDAHLHDSGKSIDWLDPKTYDVNGKIYPLLKFIDDTLGLRLNSEEGRRLLYLYSINKGDTMMQDLVDGAVKFLINVNVLAAYELAVERALSEGREPSSLLDCILDTELGVLYSHIVSKGKNQPHASVDLSLKAAKNLLYEEGENNFELWGTNRQALWIDGYAQAYTTLNATKLKASTKNFAGNLEQAGRTNFLANEMRYYLDKARKMVQEHLQALLKINDDPKLNDELKAERKEIKPAVAYLTLVQKPGLYVNTIIQSDLKLPNGDVKAIKKLNAAELIVNAVFQQYYGTYYSDDPTLNGKFILQPTTYSDKSTIPAYIYNATSHVSYQNDKGAIKTLEHGYMELTEDEVVTILTNTLGQFYQQVIKNVVFDWKRVLNNSGIQSKFPEAEKAIQNFLAFSPKEQVENSMAQLEKVFFAIDSKNVAAFLEACTQVASRSDIELIENVHYVKPKKGLYFNEVLNYYANYLYKEEEYLRARLQEEKLNFLNDLLRSQVVIDTENPTYSKAVNKVLKDKDIRKSWTEQGLLILARVKTKGGEILRSITQGAEVTLGPGEKLELNPIFESFVNALLALSSEQRIILSGSSIAHPYTKIKGIPEAVLDPVNNPNLKNGNFDFSDVKTWYLFISKNKDKQGAKHAYNAAMVALEGIAGAEGAHLKRNVIGPATLQYVEQGAINSIPSTCKVAVFEDLKAYVGNYASPQGDIDSCDGSAHISPVWSVLENWGLQDQAVGEDKKPIWHNLGLFCGNATLFKFAAYTITRQRMALSLNSDTKMYALFKKMHNLLWTKDDHIDLVNGKRYGWAKGKDWGADEVKQLTTLEIINKLLDPTNTTKQYVVPARRIKFKTDVMGNDSLYFGSLDKVYEVISLTDAVSYRKLKIGFTDFNGRPVYVLQALGVNTKAEIQRLQLFDKDSKLVAIDIDSEGTYTIWKEGESAPLAVNLSVDLIQAYINDPNNQLHTINSLFELTVALGGLNCVEEASNGMWVPSEKIWKAVAGYCNVVSYGHQISNDGTTPFTQAEYKQPLKDKMIGYAVNHSACKVGAGNLNSSESWTQDNGTLKYIKVSTDGLGIQGDFDHEADEAEMSTPTQVLAAVILGGRLFDQVDLIYRAIGSAALNSIALEKSIVEAFNKNEKKKGDLYDMVGRIILSNFVSDSTSVDLAEQMIDFCRDNFGINLNLHENDKFYIGFSDASIFGRLVPTIVNNFNKKAIKTKNPGSGMVMIPGYGIQLSYFYDGTWHTQTDIIEALKGEENNIFTTSKARIGLLTLLDLSMAINNFLLKKQGQVVRTSYDKFEFDLGDIVQVELNGVAYIFNLNSLAKYYAFCEAFENGINREALAKLSDFKSSKDAPLNDPIHLLDVDDLSVDKLQFAQNVTKPRDLQQLKITFFDVTKQKRMSIYDIPCIRAIQTDNAKDLQHLITPRIMNKIFGALKRGYYLDSLLDYFKSDDEIKNSHHNAVSDVKYTRALAIASNLHALKYGALPGDSLETVRNRLNYNIQNNAANIALTNYSQYSPLIFVNANNKHTYVTVSANLNKEKGLQHRDFRSVKAIKKGANNSFGLYSIVELNKDMSQSIEIGRMVKRPDLKYQSGLFKNISDESKVASTNLYADENNLVFERVYFVERYTDSIGSTIYSINESAIQKIFVLNKTAQEIGEGEEPSKGSIKFKYKDKYYTLAKDKWDNVLKGIALDLYTEDSFLGVYTNNQGNLLATCAAWIAKQIGQSTLDPDKFKAEVLTPKFKEIKVSFEKSLLVLSSRIPAQSLQSFMSMDIIGFSLMETNVCYVTPIQTFLQGSDFDIDKAYMMSYFFDNSGKFIGWSSLFSYDSIEELNASTYLPMPDLIALEQSKVTDTKLRDLVSAVTKLKTDIQKLEAQTQQRAVNLRASLIKVYSNILLHIYDNSTVDAEGKTIFKYDGTAYELDTNLFNDLLTHEFYNIPRAVKQEALLNSYTSKMSLVIEDLDNVNAATTEISMDLAHAATTRSLSKTQKMALLNPMTIYLMLEENQVGKGGISVAANGEKGFFTLYYVTTALLKQFKNSGDANVLEFLKLSKTFNRIQGRWDAETPDATGLPGEYNGQPATKKFIANINPEYLAGLSDAEVDFEVDLMISQLLSAATDNAKELILKKINADLNYARMYFYLLTLGFSLNDIAAFMTSGAANLIIQYSSGNSFDMILSKFNPSVSLRLFCDHVLPLKQFFGDYKASTLKRLFTNYLSNKGYTFKTASGELTIDSYEKLVSAMLGGLKLYQVGGTTPFRMSNLMLEVQQASLSAEDEYLPHYDQNIMYRFTSWCDALMENVQRTVALKYNKKSLLFLDDVNEFKQVYLGASELSTLVQVFLSSNQGFARTLDDYDNFLDAVTKSVTDRERQLVNKKGESLAFMSAEKRDFSTIKLAVITMLGNLYTDEYITQVLNEAIKAGIPFNFSIEDWIKDTDLYRYKVKRWYNLIKHSFNIFEIIDKHPIYKTNFEILKVPHTMISKTNVRYQLRDKLRQLAKKNGYWDKKNGPKLNSVVNTILIRRFLEDANISLTIPKGWDIMHNYTSQQTVGELLLHINSGDGYASFKYIMELYIIPALQSGESCGLTYEGKDVQELANNEFIKGLKPRTTRHVPFYRLNINMSERDNTAYTKIQYLKYLEGLKALENVKVKGFTGQLFNQDMSLQDMFILYNLVVNHNMYGDDRLTTIFQAIVNPKNKNNLYGLYSQYVGSKDFAAYVLRLDEDRLKTYVDDLQIAIAPTTTETGKKYHDEPFIKVISHGLPVLHKLSSGVYYPIDVLQNDATEGAYDKLKAILFTRYGTLASIAEDTGLGYANGLMAKNEATVKQTLIELMNQSKLFIKLFCP